MTPGKNKIGLEIKTMVHCDVKPCVLVDSFKLTRCVHLQKSWKSEAAGSFEMLSNDY
jgi:hypothetical protein